MKTWNLAAALVVASTLVACGGGSSATPRGAIAIEPSTGGGAISTFSSSQPKANTNALDECGYASCVVVLEFSGEGQCGSISRGGNAVWGVGTAGSKEKADKIAVEQCAAKGGVGCVIPSWLRDQCT